MGNVDWPDHDITRDALAAALLAIGEPATVSERFADVASPQGPDAPAARELLLLAAATPEQRLALADSTGCSYAELTRWVTRADLLRIDGLNLAAAQTLCAAGVVGVRDLADRTGEDHRLDQLAAELSESRGLRAALPSADLKRWGSRAAALPGRVITDTSVILVVKGAGVQQADETLSGFVNGFWPAIYGIDRKASLTQRPDVFPPNYRSSPYDRQPLNVVTQIQTGEHRIWIKEPYWEVACQPGDPLTVLSNEWRMATYALGSWIYELFAEQDTRQGRVLQAGRLWRYLAANTLLNWAILLQVELTVIWAWLAGRLWLSFAPQLLWGNTVLILTTAGLLLGMLLALPPAVAASRRVKAHYRENEPLRALPGSNLPFLALLGGAFLLSPWAYLLWVFFWITLQLALLRARAIAWPFRELANSDSSTDDYYSVAGESDPRTGMLLIYKRDNAMARWRRVFILLYRYIVVLGLPITYLGLALARALKWTRILGSVGEAMESLLNVALGSVLGDVVDYAFDPAQANRIRQVVLTDLMHFQDRADVTSVHVFAHSQGTPITFETLFHFLPPAYRAKVKTYVTIGSVLSYYHQANPTLDPVYQERFPVRPYPDFAEGFKWMNFWNLSDPITEFYGLDEYNLIRLAPLAKLDADRQPIPLTDEEKKRHETKRYAASPSNIKTTASTKNHSAYWSDVQQIQQPFAQRVLGDLRPPAWNKMDLARPPFGLTHAALVGWLWLIWVALFAPAVLLVIAAWPLGVFAGPIAAKVAALIAYFLPHDPAWLQFAYQWLAHFGAELAASLVTALIYFAVILGLTLVYNAWAGWLASIWTRPEKKPAQPARP
jgi:hypothetical protein